jgi:hypothetical protein
VGADLRVLEADLSSSGTGAPAAQPAIRDNLPPTTRVASALSTQLEGLLTLAATMPETTLGRLQSALEKLRRPIGAPQDDTEGPIASLASLSPLEQSYVNPPVHRARLLARITSNEKPCRPDRRIRNALDQARGQPNGEELYRRALDQIASDIRVNRTNRAAHALAVLESLRDPEAYDGRGDMAADLYQRIEGELTAQERERLRVGKPEPVQAATPGVGGPTWSRRLSSFDGTRIDVELPSGASDYMSYKPYRFGTAKTIETIKRIAERHRESSGLMLRVGDIAKRGGGPIPDHASHRTGNIFDLDLVFNDGRTTAEPDRDSVNASWRSPAYDRVATRKLIKIIKSIRPEAQVLFNDPVLVSEGLTTHFPNHDNHMHTQHLS